MIFTKYTFGIACLLGVCGDFSWAEDSTGALYSPIGKRDPFRKPEFKEKVRNPSSVSSIEQYSLDQLRLRAVLREQGRSQAMFEDPKGGTFIVKQGDKVGREGGRISRILNQDVIITVRTTNYLGAESLYERVISLSETTK